LSIRRRQPGEDLLGRESLFAGGPDHEDGVAQHAVPELPAGDLVSDEVFPGPALFERRQ